MTTLELEIENARLREIIARCREFIAFAELQDDALWDLVDKLR